MEQVFKTTAKSAPVITAVLVFILLFAAKVLEKEIPYWILAAFILGCFILVYLIIFLYYRKNSDKSISVSSQKISDVDTDGGDFTVGVKGKITEKVNVDKNEIKGVKTGGGNFTIGKENN
jgi:hypothetical protein